MLNATVGVQRVRERLRLTQASRSAHVARFQELSIATARELHELIDAATDRVTRGSERVAHAMLAIRRSSRAASLRTDAGLPVAVAAIVLVSSVLSAGPATRPAGATGGTSGDGPEARVAIGGVGGIGADGIVVERFADDGDDEELTVVRALDGVDPRALDLVEEPETDLPAPIDGPFLTDGTLVKPIAVDTTVADGKGLLRTYSVRSGDTLVGIASRFDVDMMTIWWANDLKSKDDLHIGQRLTIPTLDGLVVTVREGDTLESIAAAKKVEADAIFEANELDDRVLVAGQVLVVPGAVGRPIPTPKPPPPAPKTTARSGSSSTASSGSSGSSGRSTGGGSTSGAPRSNGGSFVWPVVGGGNHISQYFRYGHYGLDIAADQGSRVRAATGGTVSFAGWKSNGGGYQVWISHGNGVYTTYNHMSGVSVGRGQRVARGQQVGRVGSSGWATGPHLHFEVWRGAVWNGGKRVNPLIYF